MITFFNLSQCVPLESLDFHRWRWIYLRSTWVEQMNYKGLLWSVPDEILMYLARGEIVYIVDASSNEKGKIERIFVPTLKALLERIWLKKEYKICCQAHVEKAMETLCLDKSLSTRFLFWKDLAKNLTETKLHGNTIEVDREYTKKEVFGYLRSAFLDI